MHAKRYRRHVIETEGLAMYSYNLRSCGIETCTIRSKSCVEAETWPQIREWIDGGSFPRVPRRPSNSRAIFNLHTDHFMGPRSPQADNMRAFRRCSLCAPMLLLVAVILASTDHGRAEAGKRKRDEKMSRAWDRNRSEAAWSVEAAKRKRYKKTPQAWDHNRPPLSRPAPGLGLQPASSVKTYVKHLTGVHSFEEGETKRRRKRAESEGFSLRLNSSQSIYNNTFVDCV